MTGKVTPRLNAYELQAERAQELTVLAGVLSVDALRARRAFGRRTRDELSARRDDNSLVREFLRDLSFLFLLRGHCESAYQLYKNVCTFPRKSFVTTFCRSREKKNSVQFFTFSSSQVFVFGEKRRFQVFVQTVRVLACFSREHSALFSEVFVRAHARRHHREVFVLT